MWATQLLPALLLHQLLLLPITIPAADGKGKRRNPLHDYKKTGELMLIKVNKTLEVKTKLLNTTEQCAKRCSRNKGLSFTCKAFAYDRVTKRCHWLSFNSLTNGVRKKQDHAFDLFEKKDYVRNCIIGKGADYKGTISVTKSGIQCQAWNSMIPHEHSISTLFRKSQTGDCSSGLDLIGRDGLQYSVSDFQCWTRPMLNCDHMINAITSHGNDLLRLNTLSYRGKDLRENYCRNPRGEEGGPWCFTTSPETRHEVCDIPLCSEVECMTCNGESYRGPMDHTESGKECQRWDLQRPHKHKFRPERYPDKGFDDNYCRNPDGKLRPWCYTLDPNTPWEFCAIKTCDAGIMNSTEAVAETTTCIQGQGEGYRGTVNTIWSGIQCQRWDSQFPHQHNITPENFKCKDLRENYCRNPDGSESPWCFTTDPNIRIGYCSQIPKCDVSNEQDCYRGNGKSYMGNLSKTRFGLTCSTWDKNIEDLRRHIQIFREPDVSKLKKNYCRNPDDDFHGPWCYTDDPLVPWDYCPISRCEGDTTPTTTSVDDTVIPCASTKHLRVVNGIPTQTNEGWVVSLTYRNKHICGGTLIKEEWVLTARQCFPSRYKDLKDYKAWLGVHNIKGKGEEKHRQVLNISQLVYGPAGSDLVLLKLSRPAILTTFVEIIRLPISGCTIPEKTSCSVYGWGYTGFNYDGLLRVANLFILGNEKCNQYLKGKITVNESEICAVAETIGAGPCERDYGGPLVCEQNRLKIVVGVIVPGRGCAIRNRPGIFVRVSYYSRWIHKIMMTYRKP